LNFKEGNSWLTGCFVSFIFLYPVAHNVASLLKALTGKEISQQPAKIKAIFTADFRV
jgi:hypothetical protein